MKRLIYFSGAVLILSLAVFAFSDAQQAEAILEVEAWSPKEIHDLGWTSHPSNGLRVVGVDELVYLFVREAGGEEITAITWTLTSRPAGSAAALDSTDTQRTTFSPDVEGLYEIGVEITATSGVAAASVTLTAARYVGVGTVGGLTPNSGAGQCGFCHSPTEETWSETGHATMFELAIDGLKSDHYTEECIECHTVGFFEGADNGGFWDRANELGWTFPEVLQPGNWADIVENFPELAAVSNIQCENCHGPGSLHKGDKTKVEVTLDEGMCGRCHEEDPYHRRNSMWKRSGHSIGVASAAGRSGCADCHSGWGFIAKVDPESGLDQKTGFQQVSCAVCHDPHETKDEGDHQIRDQDDVVLGDGTVITKGGKGKLCMNCHIGRQDAIEYAQEFQSHFGPHHSNQADMLFGVNAITWGMYVPSSTHRDALADACVSCHMYPTPETEEAGRDYVGDHTFAVTAEVNGERVDNIAACQRCHGEDLTSFHDIMAREDHDGNGEVESAMAELAGMLDRVGRLLPPLESPEVVVTPDYTKLQLNAAFNYFYVTDDGSQGMHNFQFAINLLKLSEAALQYGILTEGEILAINDAPNDQGKQVRVSWTRFGGDGVSDNPIHTYAIWRRVDDVSLAKAQDVNVLASPMLSADDIAVLEVGSRAMFGDETWDFAGSVVAASMESYNAIVPTLFDSTAADGAVWSHFVVSGHTGIPAVYAVTDPDSGYSIDNLGPVTPTGFRGTETLAGVEMTWDDPVDADFNYFALYRSTSRGFDPASVEPVTTTETSFVDQDIMIGQTYYYRLSAFDFAGNESQYTSELQLLVTSVADLPTSSIPNEYFMDQNYPNPFNPTTMITFGLKETGHVTLKVYNALGREVMALVDGEMPAGYHRVSLSAQGLSTGLYFYRIRTNSFTQVRKMVVTK